LVVEKTTVEERESERPMTGVSVSVGAERRGEWAARVILSG